MQSAATLTALLPHGNLAAAVYAAPAQPGRAQRLAMRYDNLQARLLSLSAAPRKDMQAIDGVIVLLAHTQQALRLLHGHHAH